MGMPSVVVHVFKGAISAHVLDVWIQIKHGRTGPATHLLSGEVREEEMPSPTPPPPPEANRRAGPAVTVMRVGELALPLGDCDIG